MPGTSGKLLGTNESRLKTLQVVHRNALGIPRAVLLRKAIHREVEKQSRVYQSSDRWPVAASGIQLRQCRVGPMG